MLDPGLEESARDGLAQEARGQIEGGGELKHESSWGLRKMAYEIRQRTEADYRWFRFAAPRELLGQLDHNLKIADGVLRFRLFKVDPDAPVLPAPPAPSSLPRSEGRPGRDGRGEGRDGREGREGREGRGEGREGRGESPAPAAPRGEEQPA